MSRQDAVREAILERIKIGKPVDVLLRRLAEKAPLTLIDISFGPRAIKGPILTRSLIPLLEDVERLLPAQIPIAQFYARLIELGGEAGDELYHSLLRRHVDAPWVVDVAKRAEGADMGLMHLLLLHEDDGFSRFCGLYAQAGARRGLVKAAEQLGRPEPAVALLDAGAIEVAAEAAARAFETDSRCGVVEHVAARLGPDAGHVLDRLVAHLHDSYAARGIEPLVQWYPKASERLSTLLQKG